MPEKNIAVIGAGYWGKNLVRNFHQLGVLKTICERFYWSQYCDRQQMQDTKQHQRLQGRYPRRRSFLRAVHGFYKHLQPQSGNWQDGSDSSNPC